MKVPGKRKEILRTPDAAFAELPDYPFKPHYIEVDGMRIHYVDEGIENEKTIFLLHGQPSWSYLYRHMIPVFVEAGYRVIAPDLIGFGRSDKPADSAAHTYTAHVEWMTTFVRKLGITHAAAFMQDWGGMIGLRVLAGNPEWLDRLVLANTALAEVKGPAKFMMPKILKPLRIMSGKPGIQEFARKINYGNWAGYFRHSKKPEIGKLMQLLTTRKLTRAEMDAYDIPFPDSDYYAAPRKMPEIVASDLGQVYSDWQKLKQWNNPVLTLFSDKDPWLADKGFDIQFQTSFSGAAEQPHPPVTNASHFLQEDQSNELTDRITTWLSQTRF